MSTVELRADVVVVGAGAAGMYAAITARKGGADVLLLDKSMVGRGGATVMAQMTVAAALGAEEPDNWHLHAADTLAGGREINNEPLVDLLCAEGPRRILETRAMGVRWATEGDHIHQVMAPGHSRRRCCYVGTLATGTGLITGLQKELQRLEVRRRSGIFVADVILDDAGRVAGVAGFDADRGDLVAIWAPAVILAGGGLTEMYARNSASVNMTADAHALALRAGATLVDMEMVQFFPIAHLAPRLIGLDPIMWDPFRYRLGGRLLNGEGEEFLERYAGVADEGTYTATRDVVTYAILKEVAAGRGTPHGGAWLDFRGIPKEQIRAVFAPVVDKLLAQGIDLTERAVEVAPMAHYTIGGVEADADMATGVPGLFAAGEAVGGAHGANRLSGNAITEALAFGPRAGERAAAYAHGQGAEADATARVQMHDRLARLEAVPGRNAASTIMLPVLRHRLQQVMWDRVGPFRTEEGLQQAERELAELRERDFPAARVGATRSFNREWLEWCEFENMLLAAEAVVLAARERRESRGAHQREDYPEMRPEFVKNSTVARAEGGLRHRWRAVMRRSIDVAPAEEVVVR